jgi:hypothetical protein
MGPGGRHRGLPPEALGLIDSVATVNRVPRWPAVVLGLWSIVVWVGRLRNIAADDQLDLVASLLPLSFVAGGAAVIVLSLVWGRALCPAVLVLASWTIAVWVVRVTAILLADHDAGFKAVHAVLAVVSFGLAVVALSWVAADQSGRRRAPASGTGSRPRP